MTSVALKELIVANKKYSRAIIAARKGRVEMELNEKRYEKWVEKGIKKARFYVKEQAGNDEITDLLKRLIENAFYEGYMAAKEEKLHGKISII